MTGHIFTIFHRHSHLYTSTVDSFIRPSIKEYIKNDLYFSMQKKNRINCVTYSITRAEIMGSVLVTYFHYFVFQSKNGVAKGSCKHWLAHIIC